MIEKTATELLITIDVMTLEVGVAQGVVVEKEEIKDLKREEKRRKKETKKKGLMTIEIIMIGMIKKIAGNIFIAFINIAFHIIF